MPTPATPKGEGISAEQIIATLDPRVLWTDGALSPLDVLSLWFLGGLVTLGLFVVAFRVVPTWLLGHQLKQLTARLQVDFRTVVLSPNTWDEVIGSRILQVRQLAGAWREFREACFLVDDELRNAHQADTYFRVERLEPSGPGFVRHVPSLMTSAGILGTFVGIAVGLKHMNVNVGTSDLMQAEMHKLISALAVSFRTSIWGLIGAILTTLVASTAERGLERRVLDFVAWLDGTIKRGTEQDILLKMVSVQEKQLGALNGLSHELLRGFEEMLNGREGEGGHPGIIGTMHAMQDSLQQSQSDAMNDMAGSFLDKLNEEMGDQFGGLGDSMEQMAAANRGYQEAMGVMMGQLDEVTTKQRDSAEHMGEATAGALAAVTQISSTLATLAEGIGDVQQALKQQATHSEQQAAVAAEVLEAAKVQNAGWAQHQQAIQNAYAGLESQFEALSLSVAGLVQWHNSVKAELASAIEAWHAAVTEQRGLTNSLAAERNALDAALQRVGLVEEATDTIGDATVALQDAVTAMSNTSNVFDGVKEALVEASQRLSGEDRAARAQWDTVQGELRDAASELTTGAITFRTDVNDGLKNALNAFDAQLASAAQALGQATFGLKEIVDSLALVADSFPDPDDHEDTTSRYS